MQFIMYIQHMLVFSDNIHLDILSITLCINLNIYSSWRSRGLEAQLTGTMRVLVGGGLSCRW